MVPSTVSKNFNVILALQIYTFDTDIDYEHLGLDSKRFESLITFNRLSWQHFKKIYSLGWFFINCINSLCWFFLFKSEWWLVCLLPVSPVSCTVTWLCSYFLVVLTCLSSSYVYLFLKINFSWLLLFTLYFQNELHLHLLYF